MTTAAVSTPALVTWVALALLLGLALGATAATLVAPRPRRGAAAAPADDGGAPPPRPPGARPAPELDDLPGFLDSPPGSPVPAPHAAPAPAAAPATPAVATAARVARVARVARRRGPGRHSSETLSARSTLLAMAAAAAVLVLVAVVIALLGRDDGDGGVDRAAASSPAPAAPSAPAGAADEPASRDVAAGALASRSVEPGDEGLTARASFGTVLLQRHPVGVTVTRPGLSVSSDGDRALAHVLLPTYNCLVQEPPPDPEEAGCARAATEYADLTGADLRLTRNGDRLELAASLTTYTRPPTGPPAYTGRTHRLEVTLAADGPERNGSAPASGMLRLGEDSAPTTGDPGGNVLQLPG